MRSFFTPLSDTAHAVSPIVDSGVEDIGAAVLRPTAVDSVDLTPFEVESRRIESDAIDAERAAREHRLKLDRVIHSAIVHFLIQSEFATSSYVNGYGDFGHVNNDEEVKSLLLEATRQLSPVIRDGHTREDI